MNIATLNILLLSLLHLPDSYRLVRLSIRFNNLFNSLYSLIFPLLNTFRYFNVVLIANLLLDLFKLFYNYNIGYNSFYYRIY
jgi:hypothetical protein